MPKLVTIIIPALNEDATVAQVINGCFSALRACAHDTRVIVIDDGSSDRTADLARQAGADVVSHEDNLGVGRAFRTGRDAALRSGADVIVNMDADGQFDPGDLPALITPILRGESDVVLASRFKDPALIPEMPRIKFLGNRWMSRFVAQVTGRRLHDVSCGFRAFSREAALRLSLWGNFTYTQESIIDLSVKGMRIREVPVRVRGVREAGESRVASNLWRYGYRTARIILQTYRDYEPMQFFGWVSFGFFLPGAWVGAFFLAHRFVMGRFHPHIWAGFTAAAFVGLATLTLITGIMGEMLKRIRLNQEQLLYVQRRQEYGPSAGAREEKGSSAPA